MGVADEYPMMTKEDYRMGLQKIFENIDDTQVLSFFYVYVSELARRDELVPSEILEEIKHLGNIGHCTEVGGE